LLLPHPQVPKPTSATGTNHPSLAKGSSVFMPPSYRAGATRRGARFGDLVWRPQNIALVGDGSAVR
jgi:hypothetical protein